MSRNIARMAAPAREHRRAWSANPDEARSQAKTILGAVETGADPIAAKRAAREVRTFAAIAEDFMRLHVAPKRKGRTYQTYDVLLRRHLIPALGSTRISDVRRLDVARMHNRLADAPGAANRAVALVSAIWNWSASREEVAFADNPRRV